MFVGGRVAGRIDVREQLCDVFDPVFDHGRIELTTPCVDQIAGDSVRFTDPPARFALDRLLSGRDEMLVKLFDRGFEVRFCHSPVTWPINKAPLPVTDSAEGGTRFEVTNVEFVAE